MNDNQNKRLACMVIFLVLLFGALLWICRSRPSEDVPDQRDRANTIRAELGDAQKSQQDIQRGIEKAADEVESAAQRAGDLASQIEDDGAIIEECECILRTVRQREKK